MSGDKRVDIKAVEKQIQIAVAGFGLVGRRHARAIAEVANAALCAVIDPSAESEKEAASLGVPHFSSLDALFEARHKMPDFKIDGIVLSTPTNLHAAQGELCIDHQLPTLIEKPLARDIQSAQALVEKSEAANVPLLVGHHRRYNPIIERAHQMISQGDIGTVRAVHATCWFYKPDSYFEIAPWRKLDGAGPVTVNLVHDIDLIRHLCGEITHVQAQYAPSSRGYENEELAAALLRFADGGIGTVTVSDSIVSPWSWEYTSQEYPIYPFTGQSAYQIGGSHGSLSVPDLAHWRHDDERDWWSPISSHMADHQQKDPLITQIEHFVNIIKGEEKPRVSGREGLRTLAVIDAIQVAAKTGQTIQLAKPLSSNQLAESNDVSETQSTIRPTTTKSASL